MEYKSIILNLDDPNPYVQIIGLDDSVQTIYFNQIPSNLKDILIRNVQDYLKNNPNQ